MKTISHFRKLSSFISPPAIAFAKRWRAGHFSFQKGFTLIELLIVIAILGILAAGILVAIDPIDKIDQANDSKVQNDVSGIGRANEAYATTHGGFFAATLADLVAAGELKRESAPPIGYLPAAYAFQTFINTPPVAGACASGTSCTKIVVGGPLKSKRFINASPSTPFWNYDTGTGKSCAAAAINSGCL